MPRSLRIDLVFNSNLSYARRVLRGIKQFAELRPHWGLVFQDQEGLSRKTLETVAPDGIIANVIDHGLRKILQSQNRPVVNVSPVLKESPFPRVMVDHRTVGRLAFEHLYERGLRRFGLIGHARHYYSVAREAGFREALAAGDCACRSYHEPATTSFQRRARLLALRPDLQHWLRELPKPAGVFACHDVWGLQVIEACRMMQLRVPDDVAVIGVDNDDLLCELARPSMSSIVVPAERIGFEAAVLLEQLLKGKRPPGAPRLVPPEGIVTRQSTDLLAGGDADLAEAVRFIRRNAHRSIHVRDVLDTVPISRRALEQRFQAVLHKGIAEEILHVHLERAAYLLASTTLSISEVARQAGFSSVHHLSRVFPRERGLTPTAYRAQFRSH